MRRVLVAMDGSLHAERALEHAAQLAGRAGAELELMTSTYVRAVGFSPEVLPLPGNTRHEIRERARDALHEAARPLLDQGLSVSCRIERDEPPEAICARAEAGDFHLIAMGTRGLAGLERALLGSVAERTVQLARRPVLVAHADAPAPRSLRRIVFASDFSPAARRAFDWLRGVLPLLAPEGIVLLHAHVGAPGTFAQERLSKLADELGVAWRVETRFVEGGAQEAVLRAAHACEADLIVVGSRGLSGVRHLLLGSVAERLVRCSDIPVIVAR